MLFDKFENRTVIKGIIEAIDPIHIGASEKNSLNPVEVDDGVLKDSRGFPVIPGSSLKGVLRSRFEAILRSIDENKVCNIFSDEDNNCITKEQSKKLKKEEKDIKKLSEKLYDKSCEVCKLFGGKEIAGKIQVKDSYYIGEEIKYEYRDCVGIDRETGAAKGGSKYDYEIVPRGAKFDFYMIAENLDEKQKKYFEVVEKILKGELLGVEDYISVGGKTTRGLGRIKYTEIKKESVDKNDLKKLLDLK